MGGVRTMPNNLTTPEPAINHSELNRSGNPITSMNRRSIFAFILMACLPAQLIAADPGRDTVGHIKMHVYYGTNGDPDAAGKKAVALDEPTTKLLRSQEKLNFNHYRKLGSDHQPVYRSYENWAQPFPGSDEILCRFEVESLTSKEALRLDLELWLSRKKILKSGVVLSTGKPVLVLGPEWRGGNLIISVELAPKE